MAQVKPKLRKREVIAALAAGTLAAGTAAAILLDGSEPQKPTVQTAAMGDHRTYEVGPFEEIEIVGPQDVVVTMGDTPSVRAEGSPEILAQMKVSVEGGKLKIGPAKDFEGNWTDSSDVTYYITVPKLDAFTLGGTGDVRIDRIMGDRFQGTLAGTGELKIDDLEVKTAEFNVVGTGDLVANGSADDVTVKIAGAVDVEVNAKGLQSKTARLDIAGAGDVEMTVSDRARISVFGSGDVEITGGAQCSLDRVGVGSVSCNGVEIED